MLTDSQKIFKGSDLLKIDILVAIATFSIGFEFLPQYLGLDLEGFTLAWILVPPVLVVSLIKYSRIYFSRNVLCWIAIFSFTMITYALVVNWNENINYYTVPLMLKGFLYSLIIFSFYLVHGKRARGRSTFMLTVVIVGFVAAILNIASIMGLSTIGQDIVHLGHQRYIVRISPLGDPNITTIYLVGLAVSFPFWQGLIGKRLGFIIGTLCCILVLFSILSAASRGGFLAVISGIVVLFSLRIRSLKLQEKLLFIIVFLSIIIFFLTCYDISQITIPQQFEAASVRYRSTFVSGIDIDDSLAPRIGSMLWFVKDIFTGPQLFGIGFEEFGRLAGPEVARVVLPHNTFIDMYVVGGIIGFFAYIILWWRAILVHKRYINNPDEMMSIYGEWGLALGVSMVVLLLSVSIVWTKIIWAYLGIANSLYYQTKPKKNRVRRLR
jgi:O-antigen ligase